MIQNKKGVSDVISTVLIILLVLAAVGIVGAIVLRSVGQSSQNIESGTNCATTNVQPMTCSTSSGATQIRVKRFNKASSLSIGNIYVDRYTSAGVATTPPSSADMAPNLAYDGAEYVSTLPTGGTTGDTVRVRVVYTGGLTCGSSTISCT